MTNEEASFILANIDRRVCDDELSDALDVAIKALEAQPCDDCVSRQEALSNKHIVYDDDGIGYSVVRADVIAELPSVTPTRPTGKWIEKEDYNLDIYYECSECGADYCIEGDILIHKYCPNCGARMEAETKIEQGLNFGDQDTMMPAT